MPQKVKKKLAEGSLLPLKIFVERYGLDGYPPRTVQEAARRHRITVAEVRACEAHVLVVLRRVLSA